MAQRFSSPLPHFVDTAGRPYSGGSLTFTQSNSSTPLDTYSDAGLTVANVNPVVLNAGGRPPVAIFLANRDYRVVLKDADGNTVWVADPVRSSDFASFPIVTPISGDPNGQLAGTAGSSGVQPSVAWDYQNRIWYVCSATGTAATAVWVALNAQAATTIVVPPQGYLTPTPGTAIITADAISSTSIGYEPLVGNLLPFYNGSRLVPTEFSPLTLSLHSSHAANTIYDAFGFLNSGVPTLVTGPAWNNSAAGTGSRGTGAGTTELTRLGGYLVNNVSMSARNGTTTYTVGANLATYLGSIFIDGTAGQVTCHRSYGQSRKWGVWNCFNRQPLILKAGDGTASWSYASGTIRPSNNATANSLTVFQGLAEDAFGIRFNQNSDTNGNPSSTLRNGIGWNSTTAFSGRQGYAGIHRTSGTGEVWNVRANGCAELLQVPALGINTVTALEQIEQPSGTGPLMLGTENNMVLTARWRG